MHALQVLKRRAQNQHVHNALHKMRAHLQFQCHLINKKTLTIHNASQSILDELNLECICNDNSLSFSIIAVLQVRSTSDIVDTLRHSDKQELTTT